MRWFLPTILVGVGIGGFILITQPIYDDIHSLQAEADSYSQALENSKNLQAERDRLTNKYNSFNSDDLMRLNKMLPNTVDNIQLILEIQEEAAKRGIIVKNVEFEPQQFANQNATATTADTGTTTVSNTQTSNVRRSADSSDNKPFETFELEFSVEGAYGAFVDFMRLMERSLRLVDIISISFTPGTSEKDKAYTDQYRYLFRINTYRLKD